MSVTDSTSAYCSSCIITCTGCNNYFISYSKLISNILLYSANALTAFKDAWHLCFCHATYIKHLARPTPILHIK